MTALFEPPAFDAPLSEYERLADELVAGWRARDATAIDLFRRQHPAFRRAAVPWMPADVSDAVVSAASFDAGDARLVIARVSGFRDWPSVVAYAAAVSDRDSAVSRFEAAVEALISGDVQHLRALVAADGDLVRARSTRVTSLDPPQHRATLLHYLAANGVEDHRQRSPHNAVAIAIALLEAGAEPDALADMYGGQCTTMSMLVSSTPPAASGVQVPLIDVLVDFGASVEARGGGQWTSPLVTALAFGFPEAAEALVRRGARIDTAAAAAGLGRADILATLLPDASRDDRHRALALAAQLGQLACVRLLLDAGEDAARYNPAGAHAHSTPLHQAAAAGHAAIVRLLIDRGAPLDRRDTIYDGTPLGWAEHAGQAETAAILRAAELPH